MNTIYTEKGTQHYKMGFDDGYKQGRNDGMIDLLKMKENKLELDKVAIRIPSFRISYKEIKAMRDAIQEFVDRVEKGEVRSIRTYKKFKEILARIDWRNFPEEVG